MRHIFEKKKSQKLPLRRFAWNWNSWRRRNCLRGAFRRCHSRCWCCDFCTFSTPSCAEEGGENNGELTVCCLVKKQKKNTFLSIYGLTSRREWAEAPRTRVWTSQRMLKSAFVFRSVLKIRTRRQPDVIVVYNYVTVLKWYMCTGTYTYVRKTSDERNRNGDTYARLKRAIKWRAQMEGRNINRLNNLWIDEKKTNLYANRQGRVFTFCIFRLSPRPVNLFSQLITIQTVRETYFLIPFENVCFS